MRKPIVVLADFHTVLPNKTYDQEEVVAYTTQAHLQSRSETDPSADQIKTLFRRYAIKNTKIRKRAFDSIDIGARGANIQERTTYFSERAEKILEEFYTPEVQAPQHLIHVTCTGYVSPSAVQVLVNNRGWTEKTGVTHAYHMGCYASLPAIRLAEGLVAVSSQDEARAVDIVHTEMCGLHMNALDHSPEQIVVQSLFADGHIKYSARSASQARSGLALIHICEQIVPDSRQDMSWRPAPWGMSMSLSREVPTKIAGALRGFMQRLARESGADFAQLLKRGHFAIHPGGPKIIDAAQSTLELSDRQVESSREVLLDRGNMSSATLPHVWKKMLDKELPSGTPVVSLAFGPGLTIFGALFEVI